MSNKNMLITMAFDYFDLRKISKALQGLSNYNWTKNLINCCNNVDYPSDFISPIAHLLIVRARSEDKLK